MCVLLNRCAEDPLVGSYAHEIGRQQRRRQWRLRQTDGVVSTDLYRQFPDGLLFRVSSIDLDAVHAFKVQQQFTADMMAAMPCLSLNLALDRSYS
jgi:hypothetical protein